MKWAFSIHLFFPLPFLSILAFAENPRQNCAPGMLRATPLTISVLNMHFSYEGTPFELPSTQVDGQRYSQLAQGAQGIYPKAKVQAVTDADYNKTSSIGSDLKVRKSEFIKRILSQLSDSPIAMFNYAGHGLRDRNGEFYMVLPSPALGTCVDKEGYFLHDQIPCMHYGISMTELLREMKNKGVQSVVGVIDACHAGAAKQSVDRLGSGMKADFLTAAAAHQTASEGRPNMDPGYCRGGQLSGIVEKVINDKNSDSNSDGSISWGELKAKVLDPNNQYSFSMQHAKPVTRSISVYNKISGEYYGSNHGGTNPYHHQQLGYCADTMDSLPIMRPRVTSLIEEKLPSQRAPHKQ